MNDVTAASCGSEQTEESSQQSAEDDWYMSLVMHYILGFPNWYNPLVCISPKKYAIYNLGSVMTNLKHALDFPSKYYIIISREN